MATASNAISTLNADGNARIHVGNVYETGKHCLASLRVTDPRLDKKRIEQSKGNLLPDAYKWILYNNQFQQWRDCDDYRLLWIRGDPGKGKTMLLCGIIDELEKTSTAAPVYFFCQSSDDRINSAIAILRGILFMLLDRQRHLLCHLQRKHEAAGEQLYTDPNAWVALCEILDDILQDRNLQPIYLIIDALDECETNLPSLLDLINFHSTTSSKVKWIVSSRNRLDIESQLGLTEQGAQLSLELNATSVSEAVQLYVHAKVNHLSLVKRYDERTANAVRRYLVANADGTFLWVSLVCQNLMNTRASKTLGLINTFPPGLDALYERMMRQILQMEDAEEVQLCMRILATVVTAYRPLTLQEMSAVVNCDNSLVEEVVQLCGSFLIIREATVYFVHQSAKDHLTNVDFNQSLSLGSADVHHIILLNSLKAMWNTLKRDIYHLGHPGTSIEEIRPPEPDPLAPVHYSCFYWIDHLHDSFLGTAPTSEEAQKETDSIMIFLREKFLFWLEALSLLKGMSVGLSAILKLRRLLEKIASSPLSSLIWDMDSFTRSYGGVIGIAPLQAYASALIFSPSQSITRELFAREQPRWVTLMSDIDAERGWGSCLMTLTDDHAQVDLFGISHDSRLIASATRFGIKVRDAMTGYPLIPDQISEVNVICMQFSHDDQTLFSVTMYGILSIWDIGTGHRLEKRTLVQRHNDWLMSSMTVFSQDGDRIAVGSQKTDIVRIFNLSAWAFEPKFEVRHETIQVITFSRDGSRLASGSLDSTIKIWDAMEGDCLLTLEGHTKGVISMAFLEGNRKIVSGAHDSSIKIWNIESGTCLATLQGHTHTILSVVVSNNNLRIASASMDGLVKVWNATTAECQSTYLGHQAAAETVAFSNDDRYIVSSSRDLTVKIWDATKDYSIPEFEIPAAGKSLATLTVSGDGRRIVSAEKGFIKTWDAVTTHRIASIESHEPIDSLSLSHDGQFLAFRTLQAPFCEVRSTENGSALAAFDTTNTLPCPMIFSTTSRYFLVVDNGSVHIWDLVSRRLLTRFQPADDPVCNAVFSHNDQHIAIIRSSGALEVWDIFTGEYIARFNAAYDHEIFFLHQSQRVGSVSFDSETLRIWDIRTGTSIATVNGLFAGCLGPLSSNVTKRISLRTPTGIISFKLDAATIADQSRAPIPGPRQLEGRYASYGLSRDYNWITYDGKNLLWLPPQYVSKEAVIAGTTVATLSTLRRLVLMSFSEHPSF